MQHRVYDTSFKLHSKVQAENTQWNSWNFLTRIRRRDNKKNIGCFCRFWGWATQLLLVLKLESVKQWKTVCYNCPIVYFVT